MIINGNGYYFIQDEVVLHKTFDSPCFSRVNFTKHIKGIISDGSMVYVNDEDSIICLDSELSFRWREKIEDTIVATFLYKKLLYVFTTRFLRIYNRRMIEDEVIFGGTVTGVIFLNNLFHILSETAVYIYTSDDFEPVETKIITSGASLTDIKVLNSRPIVITATNDMISYNSEGNTYEGRLPTNGRNYFSETEVFTLCDGLIGLQIENKVSSIEETEEFIGVYDKNAYFISKNRLVIKSFYLKEYSYFPECLKKQIDTILLAQKKETIFSMLPNEILSSIFSLIET